MRDYFYRPICRNKDSVCLWALILSVLAGSVWYGYGRHTMLCAAFICVMLGIEYLLKNILAAVPTGVRCAVMNVLFLIGLPFLAIDSLRFSLRICCRNARRGSFAGDVLASYVIKTGVVMYLICGFLQQVLADISNAG